MRRRGSLSRAVVALGPLALVQLLVVGPEVGVDAGHPVLEDDAHPAAGVLDDDLGAGVHGLPEGRLYVPVVVELQPSGGIGRVAFEGAAAVAPRVTPRGRAVLRGAGRQERDRRQQHHHPQAEGPHHRR